MNPSTVNSEKTFCSNCLKLSLVFSLATSSVLSKQILTATIPQSMIEEVFEKVFNILDYDGGGDITVSEFRDVLLKIGLNISYEEVREIINEHDDSGDGLMDLEEFVHMMKNQIW